MSTLCWLLMIEGLYQSYLADTHGPASRGDFLWAVKHHPDEVAGKIAAAITRWEKSHREPIRFDEIWQAMIAEAVLQYILDHGAAIDMMAGRDHDEIEQTLRSGINDLLCSHAEAATLVLDLVMASTEIESLNRILKQRENN